MAVFGNIALSALQIVPQQDLEHFAGLQFILRHNADQPSGGGVHGGAAHHIGLVFTQTLGALNGVFPILQIRKDLVLFLFVVSKKDLVLAGDLVQRGLGDIDVALIDEGG